VPLPLVIVNVLPEFEHEPPLEKLTTPPGAFAAIPKLEPYTAVPGACDVTVIVWFAFWAVTDSITWAAGEYPASPTWSYLTMQMPVPLVIVKRLAELEHAPPLEKTTGLPEAPPVAATTKLVPYVALEGACVVTVIVWPGFCAATDSVTRSAAL